MKGIILAGGSGTRLYPSTLATSKQLIPVYDKPMVYYPLCTLMLADITEILLISTPRDIQTFKDLLGDGSQWGVKIEFAVQKQPIGIPQALIIGEKFIGNERVALILGDNIFYGNELSNDLVALKSTPGATIFAYPVNDPERYGVIEFDQTGNPISINEKPDKPNSKYAVTGLYFYDNDVIEIAKKLKPSSRGELEITDVNKKYLYDGKLNIHKFGRGHAWLDTGTHQSLLEASQFVETLEKRQGLKIACPEEIAYNKGYIKTAGLRQIANKLSKSEYGKYLLKLVNENTK